MKKRFWILIGILIGFILLSCCVGRYELSLKEILQIIMGNAQKEMDKTLFYQIRLSRTFFVVIAGGSLALAGLIYQSIFQNPLVSPDVLGVSSGCSIGAIIGILSGTSGFIVSQSFAFFMGIITVLLTILLASMLKGDRRYMLVLSGIVIGSLANSVIMTLKYIADPNRQLLAIEYWLMGTFQHASFSRIISVLPLTCICMFFLYKMRWSLKVLTLGEEEAQSLGISVFVIRNIALLCATVLVSSIVSMVGVISWIGLIAPHVGRILFGNDITSSFIPTIIVGGVLLLFSDILARTLFTAEIPISILTSFLGALILTMHLLLQRK